MSNGLALMIPGMKVLHFLFHCDQDRVIVRESTINLALWTKSYQWAKGNKTVSMEETGDFIEYYCPADDLIAVTNEDVLNVTNSRWNTFEQFKSRAFKVWITQLPIDGNQWKNGRCTCPSYLKTYMCKHIVGLALRLRYVRAPPAAKDVPIGEKRKRGRPKKATRALLVD
jgi:hypothetical protein